MKNQSLRAEMISDILLTGKASMLENQITVPQTDTGKQVEYTKVTGLLFVKELGKLVP
jgi:hypothetical protein